jgi:Smg protein
MDTKIMDAVGLIGKIVSENWESIGDIEEVSQELENQGFSNRQIADAFRWIEQNTLGSDTDIMSAEGGVNSNPPPVRVLSAIEASKLKPAAVGLVMKLYERGLVDNLILEDILERAVRSESEEVDLKEMRRLTALALFSRVQEEWREHLNKTNTLIH